MHFSTFILKTNVLLNLKYIQIVLLVSGLFELSLKICQQTVQQAIQVIKRVHRNTGVCLESTCEIGQDSTYTPVSKSQLSICKLYS